VAETTGGFTSAGLALEAKTLTLASLTQAQALEIGGFAHQSTGLLEADHAVYGGGLALNVVGLGLTGVLLISGLTEVEDHLLGVEILTEYLARKGEEL